MNFVIASIVIKSTRVISFHRDLNSTHSLMTDLLNLNSAYLLTCMHFKIQYLKTFKPMMNHSEPGRLINFRVNFHLVGLSLVNWNIGDIL